MEIRRCPATVTADEEDTPLYELVWEGHLRMTLSQETCLIGVQPKTHVDMSGEFKYVKWNWMPFPGLFELHWYFTILKHTEDGFLVFVG